MKNKRVDFHIEVGDYFGTLATVLDLLRQELEKSNGSTNPKAVLSGLTADLVYLQEHYEIRKKK